MDFGPAVSKALQKDLDITRAYPEMFIIEVRMIDTLIDSVVKKLHAKLLRLLKEGGEQFVLDNNYEGMALFLAMRGVRLPSDMILAMSKTIINAARYSAEWIAPNPFKEGDLWYVRMIIDLEAENVL